MKERPIIFNSEMVRAILDDRKDQTRRVCKLTSGGHVKEPGGNRRWHPDDPEAVLACPYGQPGDGLWVREAFHYGWSLDEVHVAPTDATIGKWVRGDYDPTEDKVWYVADGNPPEKPSEIYDKWDGRKTPSIFMPRWASRIALEVKAVRVERVQDISDDEIRAEGCETDEYLEFRENAEMCAPLGSTIDGLRDVFAELWDSINAKRGFGWDVNPWVWVVEFERVTGEVM